MASSDEPLRLNEVGHFGELSKRPNPNGYAVLCVPAFESMLPFLIQRAGRQLTPDEVEEARLKAASIVVTQDVADQMAAKRAK